MKKKSDYRIVVESDGKLLRLFSITQRDNDDIVIKPQQAEFYREINGEDLQKTPLIINQKYSIHCSPNSESGINAIVQTLELSTGENIKTRNYTNALKKNNLFTILFACRCPDLDNDRYLTDDKTTIVNLTKYNSKISVLYYMIVVGNVGENFEDIIHSDFGCTTIQLNKFSVSVFWSFSHMPSDPTGSKIHVLTLPPEDFPNIYEHVANGYSKEIVIEIFKIFRNQLYNEFKNLILKISPELNNVLIDLEILGFSKQSAYIKPSH